MNIFKKKWIEIAALVIALISIFLGMINNRKIFNIEKFNKSIEYRPELVIENPSNRIKGKLDSVRYISYTDSTYFLEAVYNLNLEYKIINRGNSKARLLASVYADKYSGEKYLTKLAKNEIEITKIENPFFRDKDILPNEKFELKFKHRVENPVESSFIIHIFLLYENEFKNWYYSYIWIKYNINELTIKKIIPNNQGGKIVLDKNLINVDDWNCVSYLIPDNEKKKYKNSFEKFYSN